MIQPIRHIKLHEQVAQQLEDMILASYWPVGGSLPAERELSEQLGVSRTVVRDATRILAAKGLIEIKHGIGAIVTRDGRASFMEALDLLLRRGNYSQEELIEARQVLEVEIAALAAERATTEDLEEMRAVLEAYRTGLPDGQEVHAAHHAFHLSLVKATGNRVLVDFITPMLEITVSLSQPVGHAAHSLADYELHEAIYTKVKERDIRGVREAVRRHMAITVGRLTT